MIVYDREHIELFKTQYKTHIRESEKDILKHKEREKLIDSEFSRINYDRKFRTLHQVLKETQEDYSKFRDEHAEFFI